jgi:hypothetical protein
MSLTLGVVARGNDDQFEQHHGDADQHVVPHRSRAVVGLDRACARTAKPARSTIRPDAKRDDGSR